MEILNSLETIFSTLSHDEQVSVLRKMYGMRLKLKAIVENTPNASKKWTYWESNKLLELSNNGVSNEEIARELGRSSWAIECQKNKLKQAEP
jgi:DNA-binding NarL/FixJ family response regulator